MSEKTAIVLTVNGQDHAVLLDRPSTLLDVLRHQLHLTGTKQGCNYGVCGACTVLIDGKSARACLALAGDCGGRDVVTVEGLADDPVAIALYEALVAAGGVQCGFCTPGISVALTELLRERDGDRPTRDDIRHWLGGNICRCTGYVKIVEAAEWALEMLETHPIAEESA